MTMFSRIIVSGLFFIFSSVHADIERINVSSIGDQGNNISEYPTISADGRFVAFRSYASTLVIGDSNNVPDVFVHDRGTGLTERVSVSSSGTQGNGGSGFFPSISAESPLVAFQSRANNLVDGDTNRGDDLFVHDFGTGLTERVNVSSTGAQANFGAEHPSFSADGRFVAFTSNASNLVDNDTNGRNDVFVHDRDTRLTERISVSSNGAQGNHFSAHPSISADGRFVVFTSNASNLIGGDTNGSFDVFVHDRDTRLTERVSVSSSGAQANDSSGFGYITTSFSADGRFVTFSSRASNLVDNDTNDSIDVFVHDRDTKLTERISVSSAGAQGNAGSISPSISSDGRFVTFESSASNLVNSDTNGHSDVFVHDRVTGLTERVSMSSLGAQGNSFSAWPSISADGRFMAFTSYASNLIDGDTNSEQDIFVVNNPLINAVDEIVTIEKTINGESSISGGADPLITILAGRPYRVDYTVTNTSTTRVYDVKVFDEDQGSYQLACNLYALAPGHSTKCHRIYQAQSGINAVPARLVAKISGEGTLTSATTPQVSYVGQDALLGGLMVKHALNDKPGDDQSNAVKLIANIDQSWLFKVTNTSNIDVYKVKVYNDGVFPQNTGWEELCLIGKLKIGETRYCKRSMTAGQEGLNLMIGRAQANDSYVVGSHQYINAVNPTYYLIEP